MKNSGEELPSWLRLRDMFSFWLTNLKRHRSRRNLSSMRTLFWDSKLDRWRSNLLIVRICMEIRWDMCLVNMINLWRKKTRLSFNWKMLLKRKLPELYNCRMKLAFKRPTNRSWFLSMRKLWSNIETELMNLSKIFKCYINPLKMKSSITSKQKKLGFLSQVS